MARSSAARKPSFDHGDVRTGMGVSMYPNITDETPKLDTFWRTKLVELLSGSEFRQRMNEAFLGELVSLYLRQPKPSSPKALHSVDDLAFDQCLWGSIRKHLSPMPITVGGLPIDNMRVTDLAVLQEPHLFKDFIEDVCLLPWNYDEGSKKAMESVYSNYLRSSAWSFANIHRTIAYHDAQKFLESRSSRIEWFKTKYERENSAAKIRIVICSSSIMTTVHLVAIDFQTETDIENGVYSDISPKEFGEIGDHISSCTSQELLAEFRGFYEHGYGRSAVNNQLSKLTCENIKFLLQFIYGLDYNDRYSVVNRDDILGKVQSKDDLVRLLDQYAAEHPGEPIGELAFTAVQNTMQYEASASHQQPLRWAERVAVSRGQDPIPFLREQYGPQLERGMTLGELRMADDSLGVAVSRWISRHGVPADLNLDVRTKRQRNDEQLKEIEKAKADGRELTFSEREQKRLNYAERRRVK